MKDRYNENFNKLKTEIKEDTSGRMNKVEMYILLTVIAEFIESQHSRDEGQCKC